MESAMQPRANISGGYQTYQGRKNRKNRLWHIYTSFIINSEELSPTFMFPKP